MKKLITEIMVWTCIFYTLISLVNAFLLGQAGQSYTSTFNVVMMFVWCLIGTLTMYGQKLLSDWSPLVVLVIQYVFSTSMIVLTIYVTGFFADLHPDAYRDGIRSFSIFFLVGALVYYLLNYLDAKKQNRMLQEVKQMKG